MSRLLLWTGLGVTVLAFASLWLLDAGQALSSMFEGEPRAHAPTDAEIALMAQDVHVILGGEDLTLPLVALPRQVRLHIFFTDDGNARRAEVAKSRMAFAASAANPAAPLRLDKLDVLVRPFALNDAYHDRWRTLCPRLSRVWAKSVCDDAQAPLLQALPRSGFTLASVHNLAAFNDTFSYVGDLGDVAAHLQTMKLSLNKPSLACGAANTDGFRSCLTALLIRSDLVAVWYAFDSADETAEASAVREGRAITAFITHALGPVEDATALDAAACTARRPGRGSFKAGKESAGSCGP